jgi:hypothetical protein
MRKNFSGFRFTLTGLLLFIALVALGITALIHASPTWASVVLTSTILVLFFAASRALAVCRHPHAFWAGFAVWGFGYLYLAFGSLAYSLALGSSDVAESLLTTKLLRVTFSALPSHAASHTVGNAVSVNWHGSWYPATILEVKGGQYKIHYDRDSSSYWDEWVSPARLGPLRPEWEDFYQVGQAIWALVLAFVGGLTATRPRPK